MADLIARLERCLDRLGGVNSVAALRSATMGEHWVDEPSADKTIAFGLDTTAVFKLGTDRANTDAVDYLASRHRGPFIVPGQVVQEYWNSRLSAIDTYADNVRNRYEALALEIDKLDLTYAPFHERFKQLISEFAAMYAFAFEPGTLARIASLLETLETKAAVPYVPRARFYEIAESRESTKTPPGFKDTGHGDFYVWADFLFGLITAQDGGQVFHKAVLVTGDEKIDWSRGGQTHPLLVAEVRALANVPFETWNLARLRTYVAGELAVSTTTPTPATTAAATRLPPPPRSRKSRERPAKVEAKGPTSAPLKSKGRPA